MFDTKQLEKEGRKALPYAILISVFVLLYAANWQAVQWGVSPFLYCWLRPLGGFFEGWLNLAGLVALCWFAVAAYQRTVAGLVKSSLSVLLIYGAPTYADTLLRLGGTCR